MPPDSAVGFAPADWLLAFITALFLLVVLAWRPQCQRLFDLLAEKTGVCMLVLFVLPIVLRLLLLPHHPVPTPDIYDEFSHLLEADTFLHGRLANPPHPMHRFFETFFVLQLPTYSSIYPPGQAIVLALGRLLSGIPWTGVLLAVGAFCASCYWMMRAWVPRNWALLGGILAVVEFGPLSQWSNTYWGGSFAAVAGCLVFGALPRLHEQAKRRDAVLLGVGVGMHLLTRQFESVLLCVSIVLFLAPALSSRVHRLHLFKLSPFPLMAILPAVGLILLQNHAVTKSWTMLPEKLSQYQYGVPTSFTFQAAAVPHVPLTPEQETDYRAQSLAHGSGPDSLGRFLLRLEYRVRFYRFFFLPPLYIALFAYLFSLRDPKQWWVASTLALFALGVNVFPYLLVHYLGAVTCLFILVSINGIRRIARIRIRSVPVGSEIARILTVLCLAEFASWYVLHLFESPDFYPVLQFETWDFINHTNPQRRIEVRQRLNEIGGPLLVFVHYSPPHVYQNEWVWNEADIDASRVVFARDLGADENQKLIHYYPNRKVFVLEPDPTTPLLSPY